MDELVKLVMQKTGLPEETARTVVKVVVDYLKTKLPAPLSGEVDSLLSGGGLAGGLGELGSLFK